MKTTLSYTLMLLGVLCATLAVTNAGVNRRGFRISDKGGSQRGIGGGVEDRIGGGYGGGYGGGARGGFGGGIGGGGYSGGGDEGRAGGELTDLFICGGYGKPLCPTPSHDPLLPGTTPSVSMETSTTQLS